MKLVAFTGSLRRESLHTALLHFLAQDLAPDHELELLHYSSLPHFNADLLTAGAPPSLAALQVAVSVAAGVIIASPEYNHGVPGPLKNALDWLSRPAYKSVFAGKPVMLLSASPSPVGGARGQLQLKVVLSGMAAAVLPGPDLVLGAEAAKLDASGAPLDPVARRRLSATAARFVRWCDRLHAAE